MHFALYTILPYQAARPQKNIEEMPHESVSAMHPPGLVLILVRVIILHLLIVYAIARHICVPQKKNRAVCSFSLCVADTRCMSCLKRAREFSFPTAIPALYLAAFR